MSISNFSVSSAPGAAFLRALQEETETALSEALEELGPDASRAATARAVAEAELQRLARLRAFVAENRCAALQAESAALQPSKPKKQSLLVPGGSGLCDALRKRNSSQLGAPGNPAGLQLQSLQHALSALQFGERQPSLAEQSGSGGSAPSSSASSEGELEACSEEEHRPLVSEAVRLGVEQLLVEGEASLAMISLWRKGWGVSRPVEQSCGSLGAVWAAGEGSRSVSYGAAQLLFHNGRLEVHHVFRDGQGKETLLLPPRAAPFAAVPPGETLLSVSGEQLIFRAELEGSGVLLRPSRGLLAVSTAAAGKPRPAEDVFALQLNSVEGFALRALQGPFGAYVPLRFCNGGALAVSAGQQFRTSLRRGFAFKALSVGGSPSRQTALAHSLPRFASSDAQTSETDLAASFPSYTGPFVVLEILRFHPRYALTRVVERWVLLQAKASLSQFTVRLDNKGPLGLALRLSCEMSLSLSMGGFMLHSARSTAVAPVPTSCLLGEADSRLWLRLRHGATDEGWTRLPWGIWVIIGENLLRVEHRQFVLKSLVAEQRRNWL